jgi:hypothetical protein
MMLTHVAGGPSSTRSKRGAIASRLVDLSGEGAASDRWRAPARRLIVRCLNLPEWLLLAHGSPWRGEALPDHRRPLPPKTLTP